MEAITYGVANNEKYKLIEDGRINFIKPEMVVSIPDVIPPPKPGPLEAVDEVINFLKLNSKSKFFIYLFKFKKLKNAKSC